MTISGPAPSEASPPKKNAVQDQSPARDSSVAPEPWGWNRRQRIGLGVLLAILLVFLSIQYVRRPFGVHDAVVIVDGSQVLLPQRMDPNTASAEELSRIPHVGEALAGKIVQYREARKSTAAEGIVFHQITDLDAVPGIGKKLIEQLKPFLTFPDDALDAPATGP